MVEDSLEEDMPIHSTTSSRNYVLNEREYVGASLNLGVIEFENQENQDYLQFYTL